MDKKKALETALAQIEKAYGKKGKKVVSMNEEAVKAGMTSYCQVYIPEEWANATDSSD